MAPVSEPELRQRLRTWLADRAAMTGSKVVEEFGIERGAARIDLAVLSDDLEAYEIKSDLDNFGRMHNQIHAYNRVFGWIWIVAGQVHSQTVARIVPSWWGILRAHRGLDASITLAEQREAKPNPRQDSRSIAALLWRDEALHLIESLGLGPARSKANRTELTELIASSVDRDRLRALVARKIAGRPSPSIAAKM